MAIQCEFRIHNGCRLIDAKLGLPVGVPEDFCSKCLSNGQSSKESTELRERVVNNINASVRDNPLVAEKTVAYVGWKKTRPSWANASAWLKSEASKVFSTISLEVLNTRKQSCFGSNSTEACSMMRKHSDGFHYCGSCGCGIREEARLDGTPSKLEYPYLECPLAKPGFSNENQSILDTPIPKSDTPGQ